MNEWDQDIFHLNDEQPMPQRGSLLVAKPTVDDFFFKRSLILIVDPDEGEGAMGVVVNHYTGYNLRDIMPEIESVEEIPVFLGGPVGPQMMFYMHTLGPEVVPEAIDVGDGVWLKPSRDMLNWVHPWKAASSSSWVTVAGARGRLPVNSSGTTGPSLTTWTAT